MISSFILPGVVSAVLITALVKKVDIVNAFIEGAKNGLETVLNILPILIFVLTVIQMLRLSGALDFFVGLIGPFAQKAGVPPEILPTALLKPFSGSGTLAMLEDAISTYGVDSRIGRIAAVITASSETTFYTISVYLGPLTRKCGKVVACAVIADIVTVLIACFLVR